MDYFSLFGISVGLAADAFAVCIANGTSAKKVTINYASQFALCFGFFQAAMPVAGWLIGKAGENFINSVSHWIALLLLSYIGIDMIRESLKKSRGKITAVKSAGNVKLKTLLGLAVATSIDALATGIILPSAVGADTVPQMLTAVVIIGLVTCAISYAGIYIGKKFGELCSYKAEIFGGIILIAIGLKIFIEHMFFS